MYDPFSPQPVSTARRLPLLVGIFIGLLGGWVLTSQIRGAWLQRDSQPRPVAPRADLLPDEKNTVRLFQNASPSVVFITSVQFREDMWTSEVYEIPQGAGSGFIWDDSGHIVTNFHVVQPALSRAGKLRVTLPDHSNWDGKVIGVEPDKDLAVVRIDAPRRLLKAISLGTSKDLQVGQSVFAIGNPFGLDQTLTTGIISALGRSMRSLSGRRIEGVIQTDAAINPGNSGGPLLDSTGRLIGVNTQIVSSSGSSAGIGFAVPVDTVNEVVPQLIQHGRVIRPILDIILVPETYTRQWGLPPGVLIGRVSEGSGAAEAGLRGTTVDSDGAVNLGDLIVEVDGEDVKSYDDLRNILERHKPGDVVDLKYIRGNSQKKVKVRLQESRR